ncbi:TIGR02678 family protein [Saccharothrix sp. ALI-22-I]|uniref:TIGR02678 family protein n=1 Tax=Saccharothrix sp. ALI-22-I TaxID=1933778 RepID=UPI00097BC9C2|nr:TIGR02678 family protein [Saccharothrix sp. ALI-22-I]ONI85455.1 TIGR02678 family protein [Saccharothrix sp. ALI-22-I]
MSNLANQLVIAEREEVARGIRLLLATPLISAKSAAEAFDLVRRRREPIAKWFDYYCGWSLVVEPRLGYARLGKVRVATDPTRPARRHRAGRAPFDRRRYTLLCVVAAELLGVPVTTIGLVADRVAQATATDPVVPAFDTSNRAERMAFVDVLRLLESVGAVEVVDGSTESFVESTTAKVLYRVDATLLMRLLSAPVGASQSAVPVDEVPVRFPELLHRLSRERRYGGADEPASDVQRNLWLRHSVFRKLVDDPVVHRDELTPAELAYLSSPTGGQLLRRAADQAGFLVEERADGVMLVDPDGLATDTRFPDDSGNAKVAALLLLDTITSALGAVTTEQLLAEADGLLRRFPKWAKGYRGEDGAARLVGDALEVLRGFGLIRSDGGLVRASPAAFRYSVTATKDGDDS